VVIPSTNACAVPAMLSENPQFPMFHDVSGADR
jgi:hypothetical protein